MLTGVDITFYGADLPGAPTLGQLVSRSSHVPELPRLRLSSIDSVEADDDLLDAVRGGRAADAASASLAAVRRRSDPEAHETAAPREDAIAFCDAVRALRPDVVFGADLIAGFPTETEEMFDNSLDLVEDCGLTHLHVFPFSPRPGTPAARMPQVERGIVKERARRLRGARRAGAAQRISTPKSVRPGAF